MSGIMKADDKKKDADDADDEPPDPDVLAEEADADADDDKEKPGFGKSMDDGLSLLMKSMDDGDDKDVLCKGGCEKMYKASSMKDAMCKGCYGSKAMTKAFDEAADVVVKGEGEGSRGGKIIGHTGSGKPIYATIHGYKGAGHALHDAAGDGSGVGYQSGKGQEGWSAQDHKDAAEAHGKDAKEHGSSDNERGRLDAQALQRAHSQAADAKQPASTPDQKKSVGVHPKVQAAYDKVKGIDTSKDGFDTSHAKEHAAAFEAFHEAVKEHHGGANEKDTPAANAFSSSMKAKSRSDMGRSTAGVNDRMASASSRQHFKDAKEHAASAMGHLSGKGPKVKKGLDDDFADGFDLLSKGGPPVMVSPEMEKQKAKAEHDQREAAGIKSPVEAANAANKVDNEDDKVEKAADVFDAAAAVVSTPKVTSTPVVPAAPDNEAISKAVIAAGGENDPPEGLKAATASVPASSRVLRVPATPLILHGSEAGLRRPLSREQVLRTK